MRLRDLENNGTNMVDVIVMVNKTSENIQIDIDEVSTSAQFISVARGD